MKLLRNALAEEKEIREKITVELNQELSRKQETIDSMERRMSYDGSKNAAEELRCENLNVRKYYIILNTSNNNKYYIVRRCVHIKLKKKKNSCGTLNRPVSDSGCSIFF